MYLGHLRGYQDITESTNLDLGVSLCTWTQRFWCLRTAPI